MTLISSKFQNSSSSHCVLTIRQALPNDDFTLYFLGYDHGGDSVNSTSRTGREGVESSL